MSIDDVVRPAHYGGDANPFEPIKIIEHYGLGFCLGNTIKYTLRAGKKGNYLDDLRKARWYLDRYIQTLQENEPPLAIVEPLCDSGKVTTAFSAVVDALCDLSERDLPEEERQQSLATTQSPRSYAEEEEVSWQHFQSCMDRPDLLPVEAPCSSCLTCRHVLTIKLQQETNSDRYWICCNVCRYIKIVPSLEDWLQRNPAPDTPPVQFYHNNEGVPIATSQIVKCAQCGERSAIATRWDGGDTPCVRVSCACGFGLAEPKLYSDLREYMAARKGGSCEQGNIG